MGLGLGLGLADAAACHAQTLRRRGHRLEVCGPPDLSNVTLVLVLKVTLGALS